MIGRIPGFRAPKGRRPPLTRAMVAALATIALASCATGIIVRSQRDPVVTMTEYRTFGFFDSAGRGRNGEETIVAKALKRSVRREMEARGYRYDPVGGELRVNFEVRLADRVELFSRPVPADEYYSYRNYGSWRTRGLDVEQYKEGTLDIEMVDAAHRRLVWEGVAIGRVTDEIRQNRIEAIDKAVKAVFARYPVPAPAKP